MTDATQEAQQAGRGAIFIAFAKIYFIIAGSAIEFGLPVVLSAVAWGAYKSLTSTFNWVNAIFITGTIQAVALFTAKESDKARAFQLTGFRMHLLVAFPVCAALLAGAPLIWRVLQDPSKTGPMMLAVMIGLGYAFYAVFIGTANGNKEFHKQAALDVTMATLRAGAMLAMAIAGFGLYGVIGAWLFATGAILVVATFVVGLPKRPLPPREPVRPMLLFFAKVSIYLLLINLLLTVDTWMLKALSTDWFVSHGPDIQAALGKLSPRWMAPVIESIRPESLADAQVGFYGVVQSFSRLSYQLIIAATFVIFPLVSRTTFTDDRETTRRYVTATFRYSLVFAVAIATVIAANAEAILDIPYSTEYAHNGGPALIVLSLGMVAFAVLAIAGTILNGAGMSRGAWITAAVPLALATVSNLIVVPRLEPGRELLLGCAVATGGSMVIGAVIAGVYVRRKLGAFVPALTLIRVGAASAIAIAVARFLPSGSKVMTLAESVVVGVLFLVVLVVTRELGRADLRAVLELRRSTKKQPGGGDPG